MANAASSSNIMIYIVIIGFVIIIAYIIYLGYKQSNRKGKKASKSESYDAIGNTSNLSNSPDNRTVLILKTHVWNDNLEAFSEKLLRETNPFGVDFFIIMHSDNGKLINSVKNPNLKPHILTVSEKEIKAVYPTGFYSMWLSNHWILMWFYRKYFDSYDYFWNIEYDVRIGGASNKIWNYQGDEDFVFTVGPFQDKNWGWKNHYVGSKLDDSNKFYGYLQLARYSNKFLNYLDRTYASGENGQDEMMTFSLFVRSGYSGTKKPLAKLINNSWSVANSESDKHKKMLEESESEYRRNSKHLRIFHPVKF